MGKVERSEIAQIEFKFKRDYQKPVPIEIIKEHEEADSIWGIIWFIVRQSPIIISIIFKIIKLIEGLKMKKDGKTTFMATVKLIMGIVAAIAGLFGVAIGSDISDAVLVIAGAGYLIFDFLQGLFTKDRDEVAKEDNEVE